MSEREKMIEAMKKTMVGCVNGHKVLAETIWLPRVFEAMADSILGIGAIIPPVKIGQTVYPLYADPSFIAFVDKIEQTTNGFYFEWVQYDVGVDCTECWDAEGFNIGDIGKTVFLDETEYLIALKEREKQK